MALIDALLLSLAVYISYALRFSIFLEYAATYGIFEAGPLYVAAVMFSFYAGGVYRVYWLQTSIEELLILLKAYVLACAVLIGLYIGVEVPFVVPLSVIFPSVFWSVICPPAIAISLFDSAVRYTEA